MNTKSLIISVAMLAFAVPRLAHASCALHNEAHDVTNDYREFQPAGGANPPRNGPGVEPSGITMPAGDPGLGGAAELCGQLDIGHYDAIGGNPGDGAIDIDNYSFTVTTAHWVRFQLGVDAASVNNITRTHSGEIGLFVVQSNWPTGGLLGGNWIPGAPGNSNVVFDVFLPVGNYLFSVEAYDNQEDITAAAAYTVILDGSVTGSADPDIVQISSGGVTSCGINRHGALWCWGANNVGQLGVGTTTNSDAPVEVFSGSTSLVQVSDGGQSVCAVNAGTLYCWGDNTDGQLGIGTNGGTHYWPQQVYGTAAIGLNNISSLAVGQNHVCVGTGGAGGAGLECWGDNTYGQLGLGTTGGTYNIPQIVTLPSHDASTYFVSAVAAGDRHSCMQFFTGSGSGGTNFTDTYCWGFGGDGELGNGGTTNKSSPTNVFAFTPVHHNSADLSAKGRNTCATWNGSHYCFGDNTYGQIGDNTTTTRTSPTLHVGSPGGPSISMGYHTCYASLTTGASPFCWGFNADGELGDGTTTNRHVPTAVSDSGITYAGMTGGSEMTCAISTSALGTFPACWGNNTYGELGIGSFTNEVTPAFLSNTTTWPQ